MGWADGPQEHHYFWDAPWAMSCVFVCWEGVFWVTFPLRSLSLVPPEKKELVPIILEVGN